MFRKILKNNFRRCKGTSQHLIYRPQKSLKQRKKKPEEEQKEPRSATGANEEFEGSKKIEREESSLSPNVSLSPIKDDMRATIDGTWKGKMEQAFSSSDEEEESSGED